MQRLHNLVNNLRYWLDIPRELGGNFELSKFERRYLRDFTPRTRKDITTLDNIDNRVYHITMTFQQLADKLQLNILDLIPDAEEAEELKDEPLFHCILIDSFIEDGTLNEDLTLKQ